MTIGTFTLGVIYSELVGEPGVRFDLGRMSWIGKAASEPRVLAVGANSGLTSVDDLRRSPTPVRLSTDAVGSSTYYAMLMLAEALGLAVEIIPGFHESEGQLAMLRGDVAGLLASPTSFRRVLQQRLARLVLRIGSSSELDDALPAADDLTVSARGRALLSLLAVQTELGRVTAGPPGIPADRLAALRRAYMSALEAPALLEEATRLQFPIDPLDVAEVARQVRGALNQPPEVMSWLRAAS